MIKHSSILIMIMCLALLSCGGGGDGGSDDTPDQPTIQEVAIRDLLATWRIDPKNGITVDGQNVSNEYAGFTITMDRTTFNTTNGGNLFAAIGTWQWADSETDLIMEFNDGKTINIQTLSSSQLIINFQFAGAGGVRSGVAGSYVINLTK